MDWLKYCEDRNLLEDGNEVDLLVDGRETFETMLAALDRAQRFVSLATFIFSPDRTGSRFLEALVAAARRGVEVRVIVDGVGSMDTPRSFFEPLAQAGGEILVYHPVDPWRLKFAPWHRMHRKNLVVDGLVGFCGGLNLHDECLSTEEGGGGWHDLHARIEGPAVRELHRSFLATWIRVRGEPRSGTDLFPEAAISGTHPVAVVSAGGKHRGRRRKRIQRAYQHASRKAQRTIHIWNPYFIPHRGARRDLWNACKRGVDVKVIVPTRGNFAPVQLASEHLWARLMKVGVRIYRWPGPLMHAKAAVIDSMWSTVGSYNLDAQSLLYNLELNVTVYGESFGGTLEAKFQKDLARCIEVDQRSWRFRPFSDRLLQRLCFLFRMFL